MAKIDLRMAVPQGTAVVVREVKVVGLGEPKVVMHRVLTRHMVVAGVGSGTMA